LDVSVRAAGERWRTENAEEAFPRLIERLKGFEPELIIVEATGG
jgi:hypothetical protein